MDLKKMFKVVKNEDLKRFEFTPKKGIKENSYTVSFFECDNLEDALISIYLSISKRNKRNKTNGRN